MNTLTLKRIFRFWKKYLKCILRNRNTRGLRLIFNLVITQYCVYTLNLIYLEALVMPRLIRDCGSPRGLHGNLWGIFFAPMTMETMCLLCMAPSSLLSYFFRLRRRIKSTFPKQRPTILNRTDTYLSYVYNMYSFLVSFYVQKNKDVFGIFFRLFDRGAFHRGPKG